jgi:hypothetical protein
MRKLIGMAGVAAVCGSLLAAPAASALPPGCDHPTNPQTAQLCAQMRGNIAADQAPPQNLPENGPPCTAHWWNGCKPCSQVEPAHYDPDVPGKWVPMPSCDPNA